MGEFPLSKNELLTERPVLLIPTGEWNGVLEGLPPWDVEAARQALTEDFTAQTGEHVELVLDDEDYISGLGAENPFFLIDLWTWVGHAADTIALAAVGARLLKYLASVATRLKDSKLDPIDASKMRPVMGAPLMKLVAAKYAMDENASVASRLTEWRSEHLFSMLVSDGWFHAQQQYLVTARGELDAFVAVFDAYAAPVKMLWVNVSDITEMGS